MGIGATDVLHTVRQAREQRHAPLILELDLTADPVEGSPGDPVAAFMARRRPSLRVILDALKRLRTDDRAKVLLARVGTAGTPLARVQELRDAVGALTGTGTRTIAFADSFGEFGGGTVPYYLASAFDEVWLAPPGDLGLTGVAMETPFVRDALDKLGVRMELSQRYEYKNAVNMFLERDFTPAHREASARIVTSCYEQIVAGIASARDLTPERVRELVDAGPLSAAAALDGGLVDHLGYRDEVYDAARVSAGEGARLLFLGHYRRAAMRREAVDVLHRPSGPSTSKKVVAVIHGTGPVMLGRGRPGPLGGSAMTSDAVAAAFRAAARDDDIAAIVFRVDSPGGSYVASDLIRREVANARATGRPVIVSMGAVAASGGYFVSMEADAIVAEPGTLTGSIGVFGGKQVIGDLLDRVGIHTGSVSEGASALISSNRRGFTDTQWARLEEFLDRVYLDFTAKVAAARGLTREQVHEVARGRVWTGADALERGLVDHLGGFEKAVDLAWESAGLPATATPKLRAVPRGGLAAILPAHSSEDRTAASVRWAGADGWFGADGWAGWGSLSDLAARAGLPAAGPLLMPPVGRIV